MIALGSSPLARGLPHPGEPCPRPPRIIPARAGFTIPVTVTVEPNSGSSPLARGLRATAWGLVAIRGIIPARAGFTLIYVGNEDPLEDHPRSRGVYRVIIARISIAAGSSPLARGLRARESRAGPTARIIPARAGFTPSWGESGRPNGDHPRSRGVYMSMPSSGPRPPGSSPLARGLRHGEGRDHRRRGIIPARAGFTRPGRPGAPHPGDHPRSRGVYSSSRSESSRRSGSSPLARGLPPGRTEWAVHSRIIPARAGFTRRRWRRRWRTRDHPRSRGVYERAWSGGRIVSGSSPLARGLLMSAQAVSPHGGIIPARAGFTGFGRTAEEVLSDHPRSRGVYRRPS